MKLKDRLEQLIGPGFNASEAVAFFVLSLDEGCTDSDLLHAYELGLQYDGHIKKTAPRVNKHDR